MKKLLALTLTLALLAGCAAQPAPAAPPEPDETPQELRDWQVSFFAVLLTARQTARADAFGGALLEPELGQITIYTTKDLWRDIPQSQQESYYLDELPLPLTLRRKSCDNSLAELGATAREVAALELQTVQDIRIDLRQNRVVLCVGQWEQAQQAELESRLTHPEHCRIASGSTPNRGTVQLDSPAVYQSEQQAHEAFFRALEQVYNAWWWLPAGSWQRQACEVHPRSRWQGGCGRHTNLTLTPAEAGWQLQLTVYRDDAYATPLWQLHGPEQEDFLRWLLAGHEIGVSLQNSCNAASAPQEGGWVT